MNFICKTDNKDFNSLRGLLNHLRFLHKGKTLKEIYLIENPDSIVPKCKYCGKDTKFFGFSRGFHKSWCGDKICKKKLLIDINTEIGKEKVKNKNENIEFKNFVLENFNYYKENKDKKNFLEPYTNKNTKQLTLRRYIGMKINCEKNNHCKYCGKIIKTNIFDDKQVCFNCKGKKENNWGFKNLDKRKVANCIFLLQKRGVAWSKIKSIFQTVCNYSINSILKYNGKNCDEFFKCPETGYFLPIRKKTTILDLHLKIFNIDILEYLKKWFPEYIGYCKHCGSICWYSKNLDKKWDDLNKEFCDAKCYFDYKKDHPEEYEFSLETRKLLSDNMKRNIKKGTLNPYPNHYSRQGKLITYNGIRFRSCWECLFYITYNFKVEYEKLRIDYYSTKYKKNRTYIVDFIDTMNKIVFEVKPKCYLKDQCVIDKETALTSWCLNNNYQLQFITEDYFYSLDNSIFKMLPEVIQKYVKHFFV